MLLLCEIKSLEGLEVDPMNSIIPKLLRLLFIRHVICRVERSLIVSLDEYQSLFDLE